MGISCGSLIVHDPSKVGEDFTGYHFPNHDTLTIWPYGSTKRLPTKYQSQILYNQCLTSWINTFIYDICNTGWLRRTNTYKRRVKFDPHTYILSNLSPKSIGTIFRWDCVASQHLGAA